MGIVRPKVILTLFSVAALILLISLAQEMNRRVAVQREVRRLNEEMRTMQKTVIETENLNNYFRTDAYQDRLAREKLNYQAPGEKVVFVPHEGGRTAVNGEAEKTTERRPILEQWWRLFFVDDPPADAPAK